MPATKPTAARRTPAREPRVTAELDFDDVELDVVGDEPDPVPEGFSAMVLEPEEPEEEEFEGGTPVEEEALAVAWNASNDLFAVGLMAKTMPCSQCPVCSQKNQSGVVTLTVMVNEGT